MDIYVPPFEITNEMLGLTAEIMENLGRLANLDEMDRLPRLRKVSRVKSIHSSLAIENNTLSLKQVTDIIDGKRVLGPQDDIIAVKNAFAAYAEIDSIDPYSVKDLLDIHRIMMSGLIDGAGQFRSGNVGVFDGNGKVIHAAPPAAIARGLIDRLLDWTKNADVHMLIKSSVFHYEFEFIHPFNDGNGRMGRLWQTALLASRKPIFKFIPIESVILDDQRGYYDAFKISTDEGKANAFIAFMLKVINKAVKDIVDESGEHRERISVQITKLMRVMQSYPQSARELMDKLNIRSLVSFRKNYLLPALEAGLIGMTIPEKPTSKNQRYYKI